MGEVFYTRFVDNHRLQRGQLWYAMHIRQFHRGEVARYSTLWCDHQRGPTVPSSNRGIPVGLPSRILDK